MVAPIPGGSPRGSPRTFSLGNIRAGSRTWACMGHACVNRAAIRAAIRAAGSKGGARLCEMCGTRAGVYPKATNPGLHRLYHDGLAPRLNPDRRRWFHQLTGLRLTVVWHPDAESSLHLTSFPCPHSQRLRANGRPAPVACEKCTGDHRLPSLDGDARGWRFTCARGLTTFALSPEVAGTRPVSLLIQAAVGCEDSASPTRFDGAVRLVRLIRAKELLGDPARSVCDVAYAVGYTDAHCFRQAFKAHTGCAPSIWRQRQAATPK